MGKYEHGGRPQEDDYYSIEPIRRRRNTRSNQRAFEMKRAIQKTEDKQSLLEELARDEAAVVESGVYAPFAVSSAQQLLDVYEQSPQFETRLAFAANHLGDDSTKGAQQRRMAGNMFEDIAHGYLSAHLAQDGAVILSPDRTDVYSKYLYPNVLQKNDSGTTFLERKYSPDGLYVSSDGQIKTLFEYTLSDNEKTAKNNYRGAKNYRKAVGPAATEASFTLVTPLLTESISKRPENFDHVPVPLDKTTFGEFVKMVYEEVRQQNGFH